MTVLEGLMRSVVMILKQLRQKNCSTCMFRIAHKVAEGLKRLNEQIAQLLESNLQLKMNSHQLLAYLGRVYCSVEVEILEPSPWD